MDMTTPLLDVGDAASFVITCRRLSSTTDNRISRPHHLRARHLAQDRASV